MILLLRNLPELKKRGFAALYDKVNAIVEPKIVEYRKQTAGEAKGDVLEVGGGTGANLPFYGDDARLTVYEPNPHMARRLEQKANDAGREVTIVTEPSDTLPFPDASFDSVVSTLVLCSVPDLDAEVREIRRVLRPGGSFYFFEHVASPNHRTRQFQDWLNSPQKIFADGCNLNRDITAAILKAGFGHVDMRTLDVDFGSPLIKDAIIGVART